VSGTVLALRARPEVLTVGASGAEAITVRVQMPELWDTIAVRCAVDTPVVVLKRAALEAFGQHLHAPVEYVMKLRGHEVHHEEVSVRTTGAREGSTFLLTFRHKRPVR
jgi:hypothetical protein